jgi:hypothetical protein
MMEMDEPDVLVGVPEVSKEAADERGWNADARSHQVSSSANICVHLRLK